VSTVHKQSNAYNNTLLTLPDVSAVSVSVATHA